LESARRIAFQFFWRILLSDAWALFTLDGEELRTTSWLKLFGK